jgi:hypothetical protein
MSDILRKQILHERNRLRDPQQKLDENWLTELIGKKAVAAIRLDAELRAKTEIRRRGIVVPPWPHEPREDHLGLTEEGLDYWRAVREAVGNEPEAKRFEPSWAAKRIRKIKLKTPKRISFVAGHILFEPRLSKRERFIASLQTLVEAYERLPASEQAKFTTENAPEIGGLRFPHPIPLAQWHSAVRVYQRAAKAAAAIQSCATREAWLDGLDKAAGRNTGSYRLGGRLRLGTEE